LGNAQKSKENRSAALKWFSFFFANVSKDYLDHLQKHNLLTAYYTAYAVELDFDPYSGKPDRELVMYYFKKGIEVCPSQVGSILTFATQYYLFSDSLEIDIPHAEELLNLVAEYWDDYFNYVCANNPTESTNIIYEHKASLEQAYRFIAECYQRGNHVKKDRLKAKQYRKASKYYHTIDIASYRY